MAYRFTTFLSNNNIVSRINDIISSYPTVYSVCTALVHISLGIEDIINSLCGIIMGIINLIIALITFILSIIVLIYRLFMFKKTHPRIVLNTSYRTISDNSNTLNVCDICIENPKCIAFQCGHLTCEDCSRRLAQCPNCRADITGRIKLYL